MRPQQWRCLGLMSFRMRIHWNECIDVFVLMVKLFTVVVQAFLAITFLPPLRYPPTKRPGGPGSWKKILGPFAVILIILLKWFGKIKFLLLPILKFFPVLLKTGGSMILSLGGYALLYGWKFGAGLVALIFIHECGHLVAARRVGLKVGAPVFIPFMGAIIALKEAPKNAWIEAQVAIGGPLLGSVGALICYGLFLITNEPLFKALTYTGFFLNLFNLAPIGFLDGGRIAPDLTHLASRKTIAAGTLPNTEENLRLWLLAPRSVKPGAAACAPCPAPGGRRRPRRCG